MWTSGGCLSASAFPWPRNHWPAVSQKLSSAGQAPAHPLLSDSKAFIPISKKKCGTSGRAAKLHLHFPTSPAECWSSSMLLQIVHEELVCWYIDLIWESGGLTPRYDWKNSQTNMWTHANEEEYSISKAFAAGTQRQQTKIQLQKISRQYVCLWAPG